MRKSFTFNGKRYEVYGSSQKELDDKYFYKRLELENEVNNSVYTVSEWGEIWLEKYKKPSVNKKNYSLYSGRLHKYIYPQIGNKRLNAVSQSDCQIILNNCIGMSGTYILKIYNTLNSMFVSAENEGLISKNPASNLIIPKGDNKSRRSLTSEEKKLFLDTAEKSSHGLYFKLMYYCGLRPHECSLIQGKDVVGNRLHIRGIKNANSDRWVVIPDVLVLPDLKREDYLFPNLTESKRKRWWNVFKREMNIAGGCKVYRNKVQPPYIVSEDLTPYCLRHTFCTNLEEAGVPINIARQLMGHSNIELTSKIYTHTSDEAWNLAVERINASHTYPTE